MVQDEAEQVERQPSIVHFRASYDRVLDLNPANWEKEVMEYFGNKYTTII